MVRRATIERLRSAASVTLANESIADTSSGSSTPPTPASSVARMSKSGGWGSGGRVHVKCSGKANPAGGWSSGSSIFSTSSSKPRRARGSTSSDRCRSIGPLHASSGCRSTSHSWRSEYVSTKCRSSWTWKPWSMAWLFRSATNPATSMTATAATLPSALVATDWLGLLDDVAGAVARALPTVSDLGPSGLRDGQYALDLVADAAALDVLARADVGVLSEESGRRLVPGRPTVVIDPVDGSTNCSRGVPWFATSMCVVDDDGPAVALVVNQ